MEETDMPADKAGSIILCRLNEIMAKVSAVSRSPVALLPFLVGCLLLAFWQDLVFLQLGFHTDDYNFVRHGPASFADFIRPFHPIDIGWFYRPVFIDWMLAWDSIRPHNPVDLHAASLVLFGLAIFGAGTLVGRITGSALAALATAVLFAFADHMDEAIWWISSGSTLLAALFALSAYHSWLSWRRTTRAGFYWLALASLVLAMCSKEDVVSLPLCLFLFDMYLHGRLKLKIPPAKRLLPWLPIAVWTALYLFLDLTAYRHLNTITDYSSPAINLWHGLDTRKIETICTVSVWSLFVNQFGNPFPLSIGPLVLFPAVFGCLLWRSRNSSLVFTMTLIALAGALPMPIALGGRATGERFWYLPNLYGSILAGVVLYCAFRSKNQLIRPVGWALAFNAILRISYETVFYNDWEMDFTRKAVLLIIALIASYCALRIFREMRDRCLFTVALALSGLICTVGGWNIELIVAAGLIGAIFGWRQGRDPIPGMALAVLMLFGHMYSILLVLVVWIGTTNKLRPFIFHGAPQEPATPATAE